MKGLLLTAAAALLSATPAMAQSDPTPAQTQAARSGPCSDPWITIAYQELYGGTVSPAQWMCSKTLYADGNWGNFATLMRAVRDKDYGLKTYQAVPLNGTGPLAGRFALGIFNGATLVAAGGGNMIAAGAGNLVAAGGGNLVAAGGGNIIMLDPDRNALFSPGPRTLMSAAARPVPVK